MTKNNFKKRAITSILLIVLLFLIFISKFLLVFTILILGVISILEFLNILKKIFQNKLYKFLFGLTFMFYIFIFCSLFLIISNYHELKIILFSLLICCIGSDVGGYITGKTFKGPKLTKISPKKTISGSFGSILFSIFFLILTFYFFTNKFDYQILIIALITSISCQIGDLFFSYLKRKANLKDTGNFLPGHGGVLDRLDGIFLGMPLGFLSILLLN